MQLNTLHSHLPPTVSTVKSERANAQNVSLLTFHGGQFTFSTQLLTPNYIRTQFWLGGGGGLKLRIDQLITIRFYCRVYCYDNDGIK